MTRPPSALLRVDSLTKAYGAVQALRGVTFEVAAGEIFGLLGPNGAGKTTTLECILGLRRPDSGQILLGEIDPRLQPKAAKRLLGAQIQSASLQDLITPREALRLFAGFFRDSPGVDRLIEEFALAEKADAPFATLSGGQKQRLFLALAVINRPRVLLLDEPTVGLDPRSRRELHQTISGLRSTGRAILLSTHYLEEAELLCDRMGILNAGRIIAVGTASELIGRSTALPRLLVRSARPLPAALLADLPGAELIAQDDATCRWRVSDPNRAIAAVVQGLSRHGIDLLELQVQRPSLEDVFLELTGEVYPYGGDKGALPP